MSESGHTSSAFRLARLGLGVALVMVTTTLVSAQDVVVDPDLQGRILQRSDGALFVYRDGFKYPVEVADVGDDFINSLPDGDTSVTQADQAAAPTPVVAQPPPVYGPPPVPTVLPGPYVAVANPVPGDSLPVGGLDIQGKAFDPTAPVEQGSGIDRVQIFLDDRDRGGTHLGDARLGLPNTAAAPGSQFALAGWEVVVNLPTGAHILFVYARSSVTGKESFVSVPVRVGGS